jgi:SAM-dependent methyltransferase
MSNTQMSNEFDLVYESATSLGIYGILKSDKPIEDKQISAFTVDDHGQETHLASSILTYFRPDAAAQYGLSSAYCGFNIPFSYKQKNTLPTRVSLRISGTQVGQFDNLKEPENTLGVPASRVLGLSARSFFGISGFDIQEGCLRVHGVLTPPAGRFEDIEFCLPKGCSARLAWPIHAPETAAFYWYMPGSPAFSFRLDIFLSDAKPDSLNYLEFSVKVKGESEEYNSFRNITVPLSMQAFMNYPPEFNVQRVQRLSNRIGASISGVSDAHRIAKLASRYLDIHSEITAMDWGCGFGRVSRHFGMFAPRSTVLGCDIDHTNLKWLSDNLSQVKPVKSELSGLIDRDTSSVDLIWGISVMTHLRLDVQKLWLKELSRVLKPNGVMLLTVAGASSLAFTSRWISNKNIDDWNKNGQIVFGNNGAVDSDIGGKDYYIQSKQNESIVRAVWSEYVDVVDFIPAIFGYQDMVVCRPKKAVC